MMTIMLVAGVTMILSVMAAIKISEMMMVAVVVKEMMVMVGRNNNYRRREIRTMQIRIVAINIDRFNA